jgi:hypothetical protein
MKLSFWILTVGLVQVNVATTISIQFAAIKCFFHFYQVLSFLTYEKVTLKCNPDYLVGNFTTSKNAEGLPTLNVNVDVKKTLSYKIMVKSWWHSFFV